MSSNVLFWLIDGPKPKDSSVYGDKKKEKIRDAGKKLEFRIFKIIRLVTANYFVHHSPSVSYFLLTFHKFVKT